MATEREPCVCEGCGHVEGEQSWEWPSGAPAPAPVPGVLAELEMAQLRVLRCVDPPLRSARVPFSRCSPACTHGGAIRLRTHGEVERDAAFERWGDDRELPSLPQTYEHAVIEASWRIVAQRRVDGVLIFLCTRCLAKRWSPAVVA